MHPSATECENNTRGNVPSPAVIAETDEFLLDEIYHDLWLIWSYAASAIEAARRGDRDELRFKLRIQMRDCFRHAVQMHNLLSSGGGAA